MPEPHARAVELTTAMFERDTAVRALGITVDGITPGRAVATMRVSPAMVQGHGTCHGGYLFLLADTAFAYACNTDGPAVAAGADVEFLAPVLEGDLLVATAQERSLRGRSGIYDVTVRRGDEPVLEFRGRSRTVGAVRPSPQE